MKFQEGDKVSFINEKQQGVVKKNLPGNMVLVEIEDGFEFPVRENELIKIGSAQIEEPVTPVKKEQAAVHDTGSVMDICMENTAIVAAIPDGAGAVLTGPLTYYLINKSGYDILFTFYQREGKEWKGRGSGISKTSSSQELVHFKREELIDIQSFLFQGLLFSEKKLQQISTIRNEFGVLLPALNNVRKDVPGMAAFAATVTVFTEGTEEEVPVKDLLQKYNSDKQQEQPTRLKTIITQSKHPGKYGILENEREVDLHIEELINDISGLSNAQMLDIQLKHFSKEMDHALRNHFKKIIFIHGVGNGKLKSEIRKELRHYPGVAFKDADSRNYGQGATEVTFM